MNRPRFIKLFLIELTLLALIVAYFTIDSSDIYKWWVGDTQFVTCKENCNLHEKSCEVVLPSQESLSFEISPKPIPLMKPLVFSVKTTDTTLNTIELTLFATNMNMGLHSIKLLHKGDGLYQGEGMLPTCVVGNMNWQANIILNKPSHSEGATFYFQTDK